MKTRRTITFIYLAASIAFLSACSGPVVNTVKVTSTTSLVGAHPSVIYNLKRTEVNAKIDAKFVRSVITTKIGNKSTVDRKGATYRLDLFSSGAITANVEQHDDPDLAFSILTDSAESAFYSIENFSITRDGASLKVNGDFNDATIKAGEAAVGVAIDVAKFLSDVAITAAGVVKSTSLQSVEEVVLENPTVSTPTFRFTLDEFDLNDGVLSLDLIDKLGIVKRRQSAEEIIRRQHAALNVQLFEETKADAIEKADTDAKKDAIKAITDRDALTKHLNLSQSFFYDENSVTITGIPKNIFVRIKPDLPTGLLFKKKTSALEVIRAANVARGEDGKDEFGGIFYRHPGRGELSLLLVEPNNIEHYVYCDRVDLPEAGSFGYVTIDARLFTNRKTKTEFESGDVKSFTLVTSNGIEEIAKAVEKNANKALMAVQEIENKEKEKDDAGKEKAKKDKQDTANKQMLLLSKKQAIANNERLMQSKKALLTRKEATRDLESARFNRIKADLDLDPKGSPDAQEKIQAAESAKLKFETAEDAVIELRDEIEVLVAQGAKLKTELELIEQGLTVPQSTSS